MATEPSPDKSCTDTERLAIAEGKRMARRIFEKRGNHSEAHLSEEELSTLLAAVYEIAKESAPSHALPNGVPAFDPVAFYRAFPAGGNNERGDWLSRCLANMLDAYEVAKQAGCAPSTIASREKAALAAWNALSEQLEREFGLSSVEVANIQAMADAIDALNAPNTQRKFDRNEFLKECGKRQSDDCRHEMRKSIARCGGCVIDEAEARLSAASATRESGK